MTTETKTQDSNPAPGRLKAFPVGWVTSGRRLLLIGGCTDPLCRLAHALCFDWDHVHMVVPEAAPPPCPACAGDARVTVSRRPVTEEDVRAADLAIESTTDGDLAARVAGWCGRHRVPLNAMDKSEYCDVFYMSLLHRGPLVLAISSGGDAPALSSALRRWLDQKVGPGWTHAAELLAELRKALPNTPERMDVLKSLAHDPAFVALVEKDDVAGMRERIKDATDRM